MFSRLTNHFEGNRTKAIIALSLFAFGMLVFVINNTLPFVAHIHPYFWPRLIMKGLTDVFWLAGAVYGTKYYPTKRNMLLVPTLFFYVLGDIEVMFSVPLGGLLYGIGHVFMLMAILETTYIRRTQKLVFAGFVLIAAFGLLFFVDTVAMFFAGLVYGIIVTAVMAFSLSNRFFWLAGLVFYISDITGLMRITGSNTKLAYLATTTIYFAAYFMLCISVYSLNRKEVVTRNDLFMMFSAAKKKGARFWVGGSWALGLIKGDRKFSYEVIDLVYDSDKEEEFFTWLKHNRYYKEYGIEGGVGRYYSEKYGSLRTYPCLFRPDGTAILTGENGKHIELDEGFFQDVKVWRRRIPCIAPGGQELEKAVLDDAAE